MSVDLKSPTGVAPFEEGPLDKCRARFDKHETALLVDWLARQLALFLSRLDRM
jgi:hypothetical protein